MLGSDVAATGTCRAWRGAGGLIELHVHLEGSIRPGTVRELAHQSGVPVPSGLGDDGWHLTGFQDFLDQYSVACRALTTPDHFTRIAVEFVEDAAAAGITYAEVTFTPTGHARRLGSWTWPLEAVLEGFRSAGHVHGVHTSVILDHSREAAPELAVAVAETAIAFATRGVVGIGLGGDERFPAELFVEAFEIGRSAGLAAVVHAGETRGPDSIWQAIDVLGATRIGHGLSAVRSGRLLDRLRVDQIALEICPTSNLRTGVVAQLGDHPLRALYEAGVDVTINTDDPTIFGTTLPRELRLAADLIDRERRDELIDHFQTTAARHVISKQPAHAVRARPGPGT